MLKSLKIRNFRALEDFEVSRLGRVNLIVGKNNSGKSSVLEALRIYAGNARLSLLEEIAVIHDEDCLISEDSEVEPYADLFSGRRYPAPGQGIEVREIAESGGHISIQLGYLLEQSQPLADGGYTLQRKRASALDSDPVTGEIAKRALFVSKNGRNYVRLIDGVAAHGERKNGLEPDILPCSVIPTQFVSIDKLADEWDRIALTSNADVLKEAMRLVVPEFEAIAFVRKDLVKGLGGLQRSAKVKLAGIDAPVSLRSLGDGAQRILQLVLQTIAAKGGFLLIDEFENGLHYSVQEKVWGLVFELAHRLDIQVFATTHSWDCVETFAQMAKARTDIEGVLFRVGRSRRDSDRDRVIATVFDEDKLFEVTQADVEVR